MKKYMEILKKCPLFDGIDEENLIALLKCLGAFTKKYSKGETVFAEGEPARYVGIVLTGEVQIERNDFYGNRNIITKVPESRLFGEAFACAGAGKKTVYVTATKDSEIMLTDCNRIIHSCSNACEFHNRIIFNLMKILSVKNIELSEKVEIISARTTREKLMTYLLMTAKKKDSNIFAVPYDRQGLADFLGVDRSGLSVEISKLKEEGKLKCKKNEFALL